MLGQEYRGQRLAGLAHEIFLKLLKAKREVPGAAERQKTPQREDAARERAAHEFGEPRGPRRHGVRPEPQAASSGF